MLFRGAIGVVTLCLVIVSPSLQPSPDADDSAKETVLSFERPRGYVCYRAATPPKIDGRLDDDAWKDVPWSEPFVDIEGDKKPAPRFRTRMKMLWDDKCLYIGAELEEPHVWATLKQHDSIIFQDNDFEVFLDPDGDSHLYAELELNAFNTTWDLLLTKPYKDGGKAINAWEISGLKTAVHVDGTLNDPTDKDRGWSVEIVWPWDGLKEITSVPIPPRDGDQWRIDFSRVEWDIDDREHKIEKRPEHNWVWSPQGVINMHRPETWGYVQFSTAPVGKATFKPDPSGPARALLHRIYYAQQDYRKKHDKWAESLKELGLERLTHAEVIGPPRMQTTDSFFEVSVESRQPRRRWHIQSDARVWSD